MGSEAVLYILIGQSIICRQSVNGLLVREGITDCSSSLHKQWKRLLCSNSNERLVVLIESSICYLRLSFVEVLETLLYLFIRFKNIVFF